MSRLVCLSRVFISCLYVVCSHVSFWGSSAVVLYICFRCEDVFWSVFWLGIALDSCPLGLKDELIRFWWPKMKGQGHSDLCMSDSREQEYLEGIPWHLEQTTPRTQGWTMTFWLSDVQMSHKCLIGWNDEVVIYLYVQNNFTSTSLTS